MAGFEVTAEEQSGGDSQSDALLNGANQLREWLPTLDTFRTFAA
jgi:hypothetical protein